MDRKKSSIVTDIAELQRQTNNLKGTQPFGYDASNLKMVTNNNTYDEIHTIAASARLELNIYCWNADDVYPRHTVGYNQILFQIWVNNMSTPYYGEASGIGVFTPISTNSPIAPATDRLFLEIINSSSSSITIFVKAYAITTLPNGTVSI